MLIREVKTRFFFYYCAAIILSDHQKYALVVPLVVEALVQWKTSVREEEGPLLKALTLHRGHVFGNRKVVVEPHSLKKGVFTVKGREDEVCIKNMVCGKAVYELWGSSRCNLAVVSLKTARQHLYSLRFYILDLFIFLPSVLQMSHLFNLTGTLKMARGF